MPLTLRQQEVGLASGGTMHGSMTHVPGRKLRATAALVAMALLLLGLPWMTGLAQAAGNPRIDLRVLVVTNGDALADPSTNAIATQLDREGVPYTLIDSTAAGRPTIDAAFLADAAADTAHFQAVVLPNHTGGALAPAEVNLLTAYERQYGIRQVDAYNYPNADTGLATPADVVADLPGRRDGDRHRAGLAGRVLLPQGTCPSTTTTPTSARSRAT